MPELGPKIAKLIAAALTLAVMLLVASVLFNMLMPIAWSWKAAAIILAALAAHRLVRWASSALRYNP